MKQKVVEISLCLVLAFAFFGAIFVDVLERIPKPICTYYLLVSTDESIQTSLFDYDRGGSGKLYHGKSVLQAYPTFELAKEVSNRLTLQGKETKIETLAIKPSLFLTAETLGSMKTINETIMVLYRLSVNLEKGDVSQDQARQIVSDVKRVWNGCKGEKKFSDTLKDVETQLSSEYYYANQIRGALVTLCIALKETSL